LRPNAVDRGQQLTHLVLGQALLDVALERAQTPAQQIDVLARITHLQPVGLAMMSSHRLCGRFNQSAGQLLTNLMTTVVNQAGQLFHRHAAQGGSVSAILCLEPYNLTPLRKEVVG
jgi:hypothetical protein